MSIYFTYHLYHKITDRHYYGVRYADGCNPSDLWTTYFSSSEVVHKLIEDYGRGSFIARVRKIFNSKEAAIEWERRFLTKVSAATTDHWLNRSNGGSKPHTDESRRKISESLRGRTLTEDHRRKVSDSRKGIVFSEEHRRKLSEKNKTRPQSEEANRKRSETLKGKPKKPFSEEHRRKLSESNLRRGLPNEETRRKMSESQRRRQASQSSSR
jgi:hypothetical protein